MDRRRTLRIQLVRLLALLIAGTIASCQSTRLTRIPTAHCEIRVPEGWTIEAAPALFFKTDTAFGLSYPGWDRIVRDYGKDYLVGPYPVHLSVYDGSLAESGADYGWGHEGERWWFEGKARSEATFKTDKDHDSLRGVSTVGLYAAPGGEYPDSSGADAFVAVLDGRKGKIIVLIADAFFEDEKAFDEIAGGARFLF
jgi:hypothetical protein